jgi:hypothetical protein
LRLGWLTAQKILREGSKQYREGGENVYEAAIERAQQKIPDVLNAFLKDIDKPVAEVFRRTFAG